MKEPELAHILLVEDFTPLRLAWERALLMAGYQRAESVAAVRAALARLDAEPYDLVLVDLTLAPGDVFPHGGGAGIAIALRWPLTRVVFVSGHGRDAYRLGLCPPGAPVIEKPIGLHAFLAHVAHTLTMPPWRPPEDA